MPYALRGWAVVYSGSLKNKSQEKGKKDGWRRWEGREGEAGGPAFSGLVGFVWSCRLGISAVCRYLPSLRGNFYLTESKQKDKLNKRGETKRGSEEKEE